MLKFLIIVGLFISFIVIFFYLESIYSYNWVGFLLVLEDENLLKNYEGIDL